MHPPPPSKHSPSSTFTRTQLEFFPEQPQKHFDRDEKIENFNGEEGKSFLGRSESEPILLDDLHEEVSHSVETNIMIPPEHDPDIKSNLLTRINAKNKLKKSKSAPIQVPISEPSNHDFKAKNQWIVLSLWWKPKTLNYFETLTPFILQIQQLNNAQDQSLFIYNMLNNRLARYSPCLGQSFSSGIDWDRRTHALDIRKGFIRVNLKHLAIPEGPFQVFLPAGRYKLTFATKCNSKYGVRRKVNLRFRLYFP